MLIYTNIGDLLQKHVVQHKNSLYICTVFFMVLDLRLTKKIGLS